MLYSGTEGYVCLATMDREMGKFREEFFRWPGQMEEFLDKIDEIAPTVNTYYCPQVFDSPKRTKQTVAYTTCAWADLDDCDPDTMVLRPTFAIKSSPGKYQGLWLFDHMFEPQVAENISRRIAAMYRNQGADHCWNLGRLLRVPYSNNFKYTPPAAVTIMGDPRGRFRMPDFDVFPQVSGNEYVDIPFPNDLPDVTAAQILAEHEYDVDEHALALFRDEPKKETWSQALWSLTMLLFEAGLTREEVFIVCDEAACNKFRRDGKPKEYLWADVCRAFFRHEFHRKVLSPKRTEEEPPLLTESEANIVENNPTFVERYITWASSLGDAAEQYHQAGAFVALSSLLAGSVRLPTRYGTIVPNLWFMILADTTLTRKTTSMDIAVELAEEIEKSVILATDGSIEGLFTALATRPGKPGIFLRDEFSGLLDAMNKKDYMAGFAEMLTKLYDGKMQKRILRKEVVEVRDPIVILYTGGIRSKVQEILTEEQISSGFLPRFIFITAESDVTKVQPMGPPTEQDWGARSTLATELHHIFSSYQGFELEKIHGKLVSTNRKRVWPVELSHAAWTRYNELEGALMKMGVKSGKPAIYTPLYDRLGKSILKAAMLIASARQAGDEKVMVELRDIVHAIYYGEQWRKYAKEIVTEVGQSKDERRLQSIFNSILRSAGSSRSALMQAHNLTARDASYIFETLVQRGLIIRTQVGRTEYYKPNTE